MVYGNDDNQVKNIRGKALYFGTSQVAEMLNIPDSKVRYYSNVFDDILHIEISNKQRRYTQSDIDKMKFMIELKEDGMTLNQIKEYCQEVDFQDSNEIQIKENNPLGIQALAKALLEQQAILMNEMEQRITDTVVEKIITTLQTQNDQFNDMKTNLSQDVAITVEETMNRELQKSNEEFKNQINNNLDSITEKIVERIVPKFSTISEDQLQKYSEQQSKGIFERIFGKKK